MRAVCSALFVVALASTAHAEDRVPMKSPAMFGTGVATATFGSATLAGGIGMLVLWAKQITVVSGACPLCHPTTTPRDSGFLVGGTIAIVGGALAVIGSIPLLYVGASRQRNVWLTAGGVAGRF